MSGNNQYVAPRVAIAVGVTGGTVRQFGLRPPASGHYVLLLKMATQHVLYNSADCVPIVGMLLLFLGLPHTTICHVFQFGLRPNR